MKSEVSIKKKKAVFMFYVWDVLWGWCSGALARVIFETLAVVTITTKLQQLLVLNPVVTLLSSNHRDAAIRAVMLLPTHAAFRILLLHQHSFQNSGEREKWDCVKYFVLNRETNMIFLALHRNKRKVFLQNNNSMLLFLNFTNWGITCKNTFA